MCVPLSDVVFDDVKALTSWSKPCKWQDIPTLSGWDSHVSSRWLGKNLSARSDLDPTWKMKGWNPESSTFRDGKVKVLVVQSCPTLCDPMNCSSPGSSVHGIFQVRILEWVANSSSRGSSWTRDPTHVSCIGRRIPYHWAEGRPHGKTQSVCSRIYRWGTLHACPQGSKKLKQI